MVARNESPDPWRDLKGRWFLIHSRAGQYFKSFPVPFAGVVPPPPTQAELAHNGVIWPLRSVSLIRITYDNGYYRQRCRLDQAKPKAPS